MRIPPPLLSGLRPLARQQQQQQAVAAVRRASSSSSAQRRRPRRLVSSLLGATTLLGLAAYDRLEEGVVVRTLRTFSTGALIALDFKLFFDPNDVEQMDRIHERTARRIHDVCTRNAGLYIKLGQSLAVQSAILPKPYQDALLGIFDAAPQISYDSVCAVMRSEFGALSPDDLFDDFEQTPVASASIAQVHRAKLKGTQRQVAVKVRKPAIPKQVNWDLRAYKALLWTYEKLFDLPVYFVADYVAQQMRQEIDLAHEARNAERTREFIERTPALRGKVVVPEVHWDVTGESVMTADYVPGCKLTDREGIEKQGLSIRAVMDTAVDLSSAMMFVNGFVHADPHPGNLLVRQRPDKPSRPQIVLIDHGLYIDMPREFRLQYATLWRSLFVGDVRTIERIAGEWGIARDNSDLFASAMLLRPHRLRRGGGEGKRKQVSQDEARMNARAQLKERLKAMLENEQQIPRELIFLMRTMRMMQANNQALGSPSNRINIIGHWAAEGQKLATRRAPTVRNFVVEQAQLALFRVVLFIVDAGFYLTVVRQRVLELFGRKNEGFEDLLARQVSDLARDELGIELDDSAFIG